MVVGVFLFVCGCVFDQFFLRADHHMCVTMLLPQFISGEVLLNLQKLDDVRHKKIGI